MVKIEMSKEVSTYVLCGPEVEENSNVHGWWRKLSRYKYDWKWRFAHVVNLKMLILKLD